MGLRLRRYPRPSHAPSLASSLPHLDVSCHSVNSCASDYAPGSLASAEDTKDREGGGEGGREEGEEASRDGKQDGRSAWDQAVGGPPSAPPSVPPSVPPWHQSYHALSPNGTLLRALIHHAGLTFSSLPTFPLPSTAGVEGSAILRGGLERGRRSREGAQEGGGEGEKEEGGGDFSLPPSLLPSPPHPHVGVGGVHCLRMVVDLLVLRAVYRQVGKEGEREGGREGKSGFAACMLCILTGFNILRWIPFRFM